ncbi:MAG: hypothetical protein IJS87_00300, partial [Rhodocyclaceae bacterium]|nr:hypothetical protein [Rhodocyclaceae bacterium]
IRKRWQQEHAAETPQARTWRLMGRGARESILDDLGIEPEDLYAAAKEEAISEGREYWADAQLQHFTLNSIPEKMRSLIMDALDAAQRVPHEVRDLIYGETREDLEAPQVVDDADLDLRSLHWDDIGRFTPERAAEKKRRLDALHALSIETLEATREALSGKANRHLRREIEDILDGKLGAHEVLYASEEELAKKPDELLRKVALRAYKAASREKATAEIARRLGAPTEDTSAWTRMSAEEIGRITIEPVELALEGWADEIKAGRKDDGKDAESLSKRAVDWYAKNVHPMIFGKNDDMGVLVRFGADGGGETFATSRGLRGGWRAEVVRVLPQLVQRAVKISESAPDARRVKNTRAFHVLVVPVRVDGKVWAARLTLREALRAPDGVAHKFYALSEFEIENGLVASGFAAGEVTSRARPASSKPLTVPVTDLARAGKVEIAPAPAAEQKKANLKDFGEKPGGARKDELAPVAEAFDNLFATVEQRETDKGVALFSRAASGGDAAQDAQVRELARAEGISEDEARARIEQAQREFVQTQRAYGGKAAYDAAKKAGKTKLNYRQWVQVRMPAFKAWFGDWQAKRARDALMDMDAV